MSCHAATLLKNVHIYRSLVDLVVIRVELGWKDHGSIIRNCDRKKTENT
jgi:hypothetical protein